MSNEQRNLPIKSIREPRIALRPVRRNDAEYVELVESVRKDGILQPVLVRPWDDEYEIVEGRHRLAAAKEAGLVEIPAMIRDMTDEEVLIFQLKCNTIRPKTRSFEYARRLKILMEKGLTLVQLSAMIDKTPKWVQDQLQLNRLHEKARPAFERGEISMSAALALANLPQDIQVHYIDDAIALKAPEFVERAKAVLRDYKAHLLNLQRDDREIGAARPALRHINVIKKESVKPRDAHKVLKAAGAETALDGWNACLAWLFKLDPISVKRRKAGNKERNSDRLADRSEYHRLNREMIRKFVKPESFNGDYRNGE